MNPIKLEIYKSLFTAITDEMGIVLQKSAFSSNIKERKDFSCALFDKNGELVIQAAHIPVHLGSMQIAVKKALVKVNLEVGDIIMVNDPFSGGTHLPDITVIAPFYYNEQAVFYLANRAHYADVGGMTPGSMPLSTSIYQEGIRIPPIRIMKSGQLDKDLLSLLLANMRNNDEREGDLQAQISSLKIGQLRIEELTKKYEINEIMDYMAELQNYSERMMRSCIKNIVDGIYEFEDYMDDDGIEDKAIKIAVKITIEDDSVIVNFKESGNEVQGSINANLAITTSAVFYVFRCLLGTSAPSNSGLMRAINIKTREGSIVDATFPRAIAGGNVETSQRVVDVLLGALSQALKETIPAASQGTMNNFSIGGFDPFNKKEFAYYETIGGGMGARPNSKGLNAVQSHMTNTLNTPIEALETSLPVEIIKYAIRKGSGAKGKYAGGDGIIKKIKLLCSANGSILSDRRKTPPYGLFGGESGKPGKNILIRAGREKILPSKCNLEFKKGDIISIHTPGGGAYGIGK